MSCTAKACTGGKYRRKSTVIIAIAAIVAIIGFVMTIYSLVKSSWLFAASYFLALILLFTYIIIRVNTVYVTYLATDRENLIMKNWSNDFLPYDVGNKIKVLSEFVPAKTKIIKIPVNEIQRIIIGTKNFIKRNSQDDEKFLGAIAPYEISKDYYKKRTVSAMDIFYVKLVDNDSYYMPIMNFNSKNVKKILTIITKVNPNIEIQMGSREYRAFKKTAE